MMIKMSASVNCTLFPRLTATPSSKVSKTPGMVHFDDREWSTLTGRVAPVVVVAVVAVVLSLLSLLLSFFSLWIVWIGGLYRPARGGRRLWPQIGPASRTRRAAAPRPQSTVV